MNIDKKAEDIIESKNKVLKSSKKQKIVAMVVAVFLLALIAVLILINRQSEKYEVTTFSMGSYVQQSVYGSSKEETAQKAANEIAKLDDLISWRITDSDIEKLNMNAGKESQEIDSFTYSLLELCKDVGETSVGNFDVTIAPLSRLWNFDESENYVPTDEMIKKLLPDVNYENIILRDDKTAALKTAKTQIDLGAVGKGAACDIAINAYEQSGISAAIVAVGGSVGVYGEKPFADDWKIAVRDPNADGSIGEISITDGFISTSGDYEKAFEEDGVLYHHILDPKTGYPADSGLTSVTVKSSSGALSDALSTACFVLGLNDGIKLLEVYDASGIFITDSGVIHLTGEMKNAFTLRDDSYKIYSPAMRESRLDTEASDEVSNE